MKAAKHQSQLTAAERALQERLKDYAEPIQPVTWQEISARQEAAIADQAPRRRWPLWLAPLQLPQQWPGCGYFSRSK